jgi:hypothetical protein
VSSVDFFVCSFFFPCLLRFFALGVDLDFLGEVSRLFAFIFIGEESRFFDLLGEESRLLDFVSESSRLVDLFSTGSFSFGSSGSVLFDFLTGLLFTCISLISSSSCILKSGSLINALV